MIDIISAGSKLVFGITGALAEFERALIVERTHAGLASARVRGRHRGHPRAFTGTQLAKAAGEIAADRKTSYTLTALCDEQAIEIISPLSCRRREPLCNGMGTRLPAFTL